MCTFAKMDDAETWLENLIPTIFMLFSRAENDTTWHLQKILDRST